MTLIHVLNCPGLEVGGLETGRLIRCKTADDKGLQKSGWYRFFDDADLMTCVYGDWRTGQRGVWVSGGARRQTPEQRAATNWLIEQARQWAVNRVKLMTLWERV